MEQHQISQPTNQLAWLELVPDHRLLRIVPTVDLGVVGFFDGRLFDVLRGRQKHVFGRPIVLDYHHKPKLFVVN